jgi:quaternary ammonium compound-resistance protein SugE
MAPSWIFLFIAGLFEVGWAAGLKASEGFTRPLWSTVTVVAMAASLGFLGLALRGLPLGPAYAVWTGIGTVGASLVGLMLFHEQLTLLRLVSLLLIVAGIAGMKLATD